MNPKQLFLDDKDIADQWAAISHSTWFQTVMAYTMAELVTGRVITSEQLEGAKMFAAALSSMADDDAKMVPMPTSGINHNFDVITKPTFKVQPKE